MKLNTILECDFSNKKALVRVDFNVPIKDGVVTDDTRIRAALPTLTYLLEKGAAVIVMSHFGRPKGKKNPEFSMAPIAKRFSELLEKEVLLAPDVIGEEVEKQVSALKAGDVLLLENVRFYAEEEKNDPDFAKSLA
ncbi:MAG: phosphoglycerate kinase, partial [Spirochaetia bacterium]|nr:phosphoglycerate kinase [Spirochaetia bacterium]